MHPIRIAVLLLALLALLSPAGVAVADLPQTGSTFRDCEACPAMVVVPAGAVMMGSPPSVTEREGEPEKRGKRERPVHRVEIARPFAVGRFEVTRGEYAAFVAATGRPDAPGCKVWTGTDFTFVRGAGWREPGYPQSDLHPVTCVSWTDARAYVDWLAGSTGKPYRLPSEAEWEYLARAGTDSARFWGDDAKDACGFGNVYDAAAAHTGAFPKMAPHACDDGHAGTSSAGSFRPNAFGLHDTAGNVWEWVEDCWHASYKDAPADGSAWTASGDCTQRILRGGAWISTAQYVRSANRSKMDADTHIYRNGFRVVRALAP